MNKTQKNRDRRETNAQVERAMTEKKDTFNEIDVEHGCSRQKKPE